MGNGGYGDDAAEFQLVEVRNVEQDRADPQALGRAGRQERSPMKSLILVSFDLLEHFKS